MGKKFYNIGIFAHVDAGKTSVTEQLLLKSGMIRNAGNIEKGTTVTDYLETEKSRGISIRSACVYINDGPLEICIIDTPGHIDFSGEVERTLGVIDGAVLILSASDGIQSYSRIIWDLLRRNGIPVLILINKIDITSSDAAGVLEELTDTFKCPFIPVEDIVFEGTDDADIAGGGFINKIISKTDIVPLLADFEPSFEEVFLNDEKIEESTIYDTFIRLCRTAYVCPVLYSSAKYGKGIAELLDGIKTFLPEADTGNETDLSGTVFKVEHYDMLGKAAYMRLFSGRLSVRDTLNGSKISQIRKYSGTKYTDVDSLGPGETGAVFGIPDIKNGDSIGKTDPRYIHISDPMLISKIEPDDISRKNDLIKALKIINDEDPSLNLEFNHELSEIFIRFTGNIQKEFYHDLIESRFDMRVSISDPSVVYKETPSRRATGFYAYTMPKPCWAVVELMIEPLERGRGIIFESLIKDNIIPYRYQNHIRQSVFQSIGQGILGWEITDAKISLIGGEHHNVHTHPLDFFVATPVALLRALKNSDPELLEPVLRYNLSASDAYLGKTITKVLEMGGSFGQPELHSGSFRLYADIPLRTSIDFPGEFRSMTSGNGTVSYDLLKYDICPEPKGRERARLSVDPLDLQRWILYCRNALQ